MADFGAPPPGQAGAGGHLNEEQLMSAVQMSMQQEEAMRFFATVREKCFDKCIDKPGATLSSSEERCLSNCLARYIDATRAVATSLSQGSQ